MANTVQITVGTESPDPGLGLQARLHDPLWLLARQWQLGEFQGEDCGSPVTAAVRYESAPLSRYRPGPATAGQPAESYAPHAVPLETLVEREAMSGGEAPDLRAAAEAGLHLLRLLGNAGLAGLRAGLLPIYRLQPPNTESPLDPDSRAYLGVVAGRVIDGARLQAKLRPLANAGRLPELFQEAPFDAIGEPDRPQLLATLERWLGWYRERFGTITGEPAAWIPERLEYAFAVSGSLSDGEVVLAAPEYLEGHLDWHSFVGQPGASLGAVAAPITTAKSFLPAPVSYPGMPSPRFWEFEDGRINLAKLETSPDDPARRLLVDFALEFGNDWFILPLELAAGSLCRIRALTVTNSFGERLLIPHSSEVDGPQSPWRAFALSQASPQLFFLAPALGPGLQGQPLEDVQFLRDEMANLAWAVERVVPSAAGRPLDRYEAYQQALERLDPPSPAGAEGSLRYRLGTTVPDYWIPLMPVQRDDGLRLRRARLPDAATATGKAGPLGSILVPARDLLLHDEEVPREGARVTRSCQYHRWVDGTSQLWIGRRKRPGRGEGSSGLRFDTAENT